ncbi:MAG: nicotinate-nucleotide adenylyltransferase [Planctomycetia bacterium]|nr:nicotinate-nucleotide adenylyltransferase [Planctomycetia bacterium]
MRIGIFGGTFDPIHYGHLLLAESCREQCRLDEVWFVPAAIPPHKREQYLSSPAARLQMLHLAIDGNEAFRVSEIELQRDGISYTVDTLAEIKRQRPDAELFLCVGADTLHDLPTWREPERVCALAVPIAVCRPGSGEPNYEAIATLVSPERLALIRAHRVDMPPIGISSRDLRSRAAEGRSLRYQTPRAVEKYSETHGLYRHDTRQTSP